MTDGAVNNSCDIIDWVIVRERKRQNARFITRFTGIVVLRNHRYIIDRSFQRSFFTDQIVSSSFHLSQISFQRMAAVAAPAATTMGHHTTVKVGVERSQDDNLLDEGMREAELLLQSIMGAKRRISNNVQVMFAPPIKRRRSFHQRKTVRFAQADTVRTIADSSDEDDALLQCWYQKHEYRRIKEDNNETLRAIARAYGKISDIDASEHCIRGLELLIRVYILQLPHDNRQKKVVQSVLSLQQSQKKLQQNDSTALREMSLIVSKPDKLKAWRTAILDAQK